MTASSALGLTSSQYLTRATGSALNITSCTLMSWIRRSGTTGAVRVAWALENGASIYVAGLIGVSGTALDIWHSDTGGLGSVPLATNVWTCVICVSTATSWTVYYKTETALSLTTITPGGAPGTVSNGGLAMDWGASTGGSSGIGEQMCLFRAWNAQLSAAEALVEARSPRPRRTANLYFATSTNSTTNSGADESGNANHFTNGGQPYTLVAGPTFRDWNPAAWSQPRNHPSRNRLLRM